LSNPKPKPENISGSITIIDQNQKKQDRQKKRNVFQLKYDISKLSKQH